MKSKILTLRLNPKQHTALASEAKVNNIGFSEFLRYKLGFERRSDIDRVIFLLNKSSNNINQIARGINIANLAQKVNEFTYSQTLARLAIVQQDFTNIYNTIKNIKNAN